MKLHFNLFFIKKSGTHIYFLIEKRRGKLGKNKAEKRKTLSKEFISQKIKKKFIKKKKKIKKKKIQTFMKLDITKS